MSFEEVFEKVMGKYQRIITKAEHKMLRDMYTGRQEGVTVTPKNPKDKIPPEHLKVFSNLLTQEYLRNYGKIKQEVLKAGREYLLK